MKLLLLPILLLAASTSAAPAESSSQIVVNKALFAELPVVYTGEHEIVDLFVPLNKLNFDSNEEDDESVTMFIVEADVSNGVRQDQGLYLLKKTKTKKLLDNGRGAAALNDDSTKVYLAAADGIYIYNDENGKTEKYGTVTDSVIQIVADNQTNTIYYVTADRKLFTLNQNGDGERVEAVNDVKEVAIDYAGNIFYYGANNELYVFNSDGVKKIQNLPERINNVRLIRPMFAQDDGVFAIVNNKLFILNPNSTVSEASNLKLEVVPTAYAIDATLIHYYALDKMVYEFNVIEVALTSALEELKSYLDEKQDDIKAISTRRRTAFGS